MRVGGRNHSSVGARRRLRSAGADRGRHVASTGRCGERRPDRVDAWTRDRGRRSFANLSPILPRAKLLPMAQTAETRIQLCGRLVVRLDGRRVEDALPGAKGQLLLRLPRAQPAPADRPRRAAAGRLRRGGDARPPPRLASCSRSCAASSGPSGSPDGRRSSSCCRPTPSSTSRRRSRRCTGRSRMSRTASGPRPGARPGSPTTWPAAPCSRATTGHGWTSGGGASRTSGCAGSSASPRRGSASAARRCPRPRSARAGSIELAPYRETGHRILMEALERRGNVAEALRVYDRLRVLLRDELGIAPSPAVQTRLPTPARRDAPRRPWLLALLGLREDVRRGNLADEVRVVLRPGALGPSPRARRRPRPRRPCRTRS